MTPAQQADALASHVGVRALEDQQLLRLEGDDQRAWLNGQVTNDVRHTTAGDGVYCLAVTVRGKIIADGWVLDDGEALSLLVPRDSVPQLLESFDAQIIMEDVEVTADEAARAFSVQGPEAERCVADAALPDSARAFRCDELGLGGRIVVCDGAEAAATLASLTASASALGGAQLDAAGWELARLRAGRARHGVDFDLKHYPQEAGLKELAVSFEKGCYLGQEVVCTLENRGKLRRQLVRLEGDGALELAAGDPIEGADGAELGAITSTQVDDERGCTLALGYVKSDHAAAGSTVRSRGHSLRVIA